ncbi:MAG: DUF6930 domain-containing protein [Candidatus Hydrogenedentota bacterium]
MSEEMESESPLSPEPEVWRECLEVCDRLAPHEVYSAFQKHGFLAIDDPDLGERIYCSAPPAERESTFRLVFITRGGDAWLRFLSALHAVGEEASVEGLFSGCDGVLILFRAWQDVPQFAREEYKELGYRRKKGQFVPLLFSVRAGWGKASLYREDVDILKRGVEQCLAVVQNPWGAMGESVASQESERALFRVRTAEKRPDGGRRWVDRWESVPAWMETGRLAIQDEDEADRLAGELTRREGAVWEAEAFYVQASMPVPPSHSDIARHFQFKLPRCFAVMEREKGLAELLGFETVLMDALEERFQPCLLKALERAQYIPEEIHTVRGDVYRALKKLCGRLGVRLYLTGTIVHGEAFRDSVKESMGDHLQKLIREAMEAPEDMPLDEFLANAAEKHFGEEPPPSEEEDNA